MSPATYLAAAVLWSIAGFFAGALFTLAVQDILNLWRHQ